MNSEHITESISKLNTHPKDLTKGQDVIVITYNNIHRGNVTKCDYYGVSISTKVSKSSAKEKLKFKYPDKSIILIDTEEANQLLSSIEDMFETYATFELLGHNNNARNIDSQLKLHSIVKRIPSDVIADLKSLVLNDNYKTMLLLSGASAEGEYAASLLSSITHNS